MKQPDSHLKAAFAAVPKRSSPARRSALLGLTTLFSVITAVELRGQTNVAADFAALTSGQAGNTTSKPGTPGTVVAFGRDAFPVLEDANGNQRSPMAAGRAGPATNSARGVAYSASGMFNTGNAVKSALFDNAVLWASRKTNRASVVVGVGPSFNTSFFTGLGYQVKSVTTSMAATNNDLTGCDVFVGDWYSAYTATAITKITNFTAAGGGVVCSTTPWQLPAADLANANLVLERFGLVYNGNYVLGGAFTVPATNWPAYHSAIPAAELLLLDKQGGTNLSAAVKDEAATTVTFAYESRGDIAPLNAIVEQISQLYGLIAPTDTATLNQNQKPVEAMLARYQSRQTIPGSALVPALGGVALAAQSPFAAWQTIQFGGNAANPAIAGPNADPDGDGLSNLAEHTLGLNPLAGNTAPWRTALTNVSGQNYLGVTVNRSAAATDVVIDAQADGSITPPAWSAGSAVTLLNTPTTFSARDTVPAGIATNRFLRLRFTLP